VPDLYGNMGDVVKSLMEKVEKMRVKDERRNLVKSVLITESIRKKSVGEAKSRRSSGSSGTAAYTPLTRSLLEGLNPSIKDM